MILLEFFLNHPNFVKQALDLSKKICELCGFANSFAGLDVIPDIGFRYVFLFRDGIDALPAVQFGLNTQQFFGRHRPVLIIVCWPFHIDALVWIK